MYMQFFIDTAELRSEICSFLEIEMPNIVFDKKLLQPSSSFACIDVKGNMCINPHYFDTPLEPMLIFAVPHELRHIWQLENSPEIFDGYLDTSILSRKAFNFQPAEIDASAFALAWMDCRYVEWDKSNLVFSNLFVNQEFRLKYMELSMEIGNRRWM